MQIDKEQNAQNAINLFLSQSCAFIMPHSTHPFAHWVGSGVIIQTNGSNVVILTAKHVAEDARREKYSLGYFRCSNSLPDFVAGVMLSPHDIDVGLLVVKDSLAGSIRCLAVTPDALNVDGKDIVEHDNIILIGYPWQISHYDHGENEQGFTSITYWCVPDNVSLDSKGRYRLEWTDATIGPGRQDFDLPSPIGMSGGPLWRFRKPTGPLLWSASSIGKVIGIQSAWDDIGKKTLFIEPNRIWCDWLTNSLDQVDQTFRKSS